MFGVRKSKFRHVFGKQMRDGWHNLDISTSAWDTNKVDVNEKYVGVILRVGGGGAFTVLDKTKPAKLNRNVPKFTGHKAAVLDIAFNPFNTQVIASASEDCMTKLYKIPEGGLTQSTNEEIQNLKGHRRKVGCVLWHPTADNVLATSSTDYSVKIWDVESGQEKVSCAGNHGDIIQGLAWNRNGSLLVSNSKDKKARIIDPRNGEVTTEFSSHQGVKGSKVTWLKHEGWFCTVGFSRSSDRQYKIWDMKNTSKPIAQSNIDTSSGSIMQFYDYDTNIMFLAGKGDGNIRYFEVTDTGKFIYYLNEFKSSVPQKGMGWQPKTACDISKCEIARMFKVTSRGDIEQIQFMVPRKSSLFQEDIYPKTAGGTPAQSAESWFGGENKDPVLVDLEEGYTPPERKVEVKKVEAKEKELSGAELKSEYQKALKKISHLESELAKATARIKELSN